MNCDVAVIGGGPAGMAAAIEASKRGADVVLLERNTALGGILNQCIHNGFGLHYFKNELTGPEYASKFCQLLKNTDVRVMTGANVLSIDENKNIEFISPQTGMQVLQAKAIVLAMGCRERPAGAIGLCGTRPSGIYTAGTAQKLTNVYGYLPGKEIVILGSGDIGLIMARRMSFEGAKVKAVIELMPYSSGLKRNIVQCVNDFDIPLFYSHTITRVEGNPRLSAVWFAPVDSNKKADLTKEQKIECDTLLLSVGLIPANDLISDIGIKMDSVTGGAITDENRQTSLAGFFSCGNVLHVHDLVDNVSLEAEIAGRNAAEFALRQTDDMPSREVSAGQGLRYVLPQKLSAKEGNVKFYFRSANVFHNAVVEVSVGEQVVKRKKFAVLSPGEMESIEVDLSLLNLDVSVKVLEE